MKRSRVTIIINKSYKSYKSYKGSRVTRGQESRSIIVLSRQRSRATLQTNYISYFMFVGFMCRCLCSRLRRNYYQAYHRLITSFLETPVITSRAVMFIHYPKYGDNVCSKLSLSREQKNFRSCCSKGLGLYFSKNRSKSKDNPYWEQLRKTSEDVFLGLGLVFEQSW